MADAVFKDLCIDVTDVDRASRFYAALLGLAPDPSRRGRLAGARPEHVVWLNEVPEPGSVKNRVHLDVHVASLQQVRALGATDVQAHPHWTVLADPEGQVFCAFVVTGPDAYRLFELGVDTADPAATAGWWADRLGGSAARDADEPWWTVGGAPGLPWDIVFNAVPEPKVGKNRVHWDVWGDPAGLVAAGATWVRPRDGSIEWDVLADPDGNEFCVFAPQGAHRPVR